MGTTCPVPVRGALVHLPYASPETITEVAPGASAAVTLLSTVPWDLGCGEARPRSCNLEVRARSWHGSKPSSVTNIKLTGTRASAKCAFKSV
jgi:hypothetical protein